MNNLEIIKSALLEKFRLYQVSQFLSWVKQKQDLMRLIETDPSRAITRLTEILTIVEAAKS